MSRFCLIRRVGLVVFLCLLLSAGMARGYGKETDPAVISMVVFVPFGAQGPLIGFENICFLGITIKADEEERQNANRITIFNDEEIIKTSILD
ncbi:MAG: hypothetical protein ACYDH3_04950 [Candidatus Aminicenantales bacterium]